MSESDQELQAAREKAIHAAALALVAREFGASMEEAARGWANFSQQQRTRYLQTADTAFEAAETAMREAGFEWQPAEDIVPETTQVPQA